MSDYEPIFDEFTSGADDVLEGKFEPDDEWECAYPGRCLMAFADHLRSECHTAEDMGPNEVDERHWSIEVKLDGESLVTIESNFLSGKPEFSTEQASLIRAAARSLLAFVGEDKTIEQEIPF